MKLHFLIVSVAILACLAPALGTLHHSLFSALLGKGALLKGLSLAASKPVLRGDAFLASKGLSANNFLKTHVFIRPVVEKHIPQRVIVLRPPQMDSIVQRIYNFHKTEVIKPAVVEPAVVHKEAKIVIPTIYYQEPEVVIPTLHVQEHHDVSYEPEISIISQPFHNERAIIDSTLYHHDPKTVVADVATHVAPQAPSVSIVGPTMNVIQHPHNNAYSG